MPRAPLPTAPILRTFLGDFNQRIASIDLAEKWDNVGFLIETRRSHDYKKLRILTCIDLTKEVVNEAVMNDCNMILAYHPILFRPIQSISIANQSPILHCIDSGISVFSPHTAMDSADGGMNDFLCDMFRDHESLRTPIRVDQVTSAKIGRIVKFYSPQSLLQVIQTLKSTLGLERVRFAAPSDDPSNLQVYSIAVCVGSGSSVLLGASASLYITGEMGHHEILACKASGKAVILLDHSSSERPFLPELARRVAEFDCVETVIVSAADVEPITSA